MFGHQDDQSTQNNDGSADDQTNDESVNTTTVSPTTDASDTSQAPLDPVTVADPDPKPADDSLISAEASGAPLMTEPSWQQTPNPTDVALAQSNDIISPAGGFPKPVSSKNFVVGAPKSDDIPAITPVSNSDETPEVDDEGESVPVLGFSTTADAPETDASDLGEIKHQALTELTPLIDKLDQTPDEKFRTYMMMIQASDDQSMIKAAFETAHKIDDEKTKAQALLDIVNEINYFTQQPSTDSSDKLTEKDS